MKKRVELLIFITLNILVLMIIFFTASTILIMKTFLQKLFLTLFNLAMIAVYVWIVINIKKTLGYLIKRRK